MSRRTRLGEILQSPHQRVGFVVERVAIALQPQQHRVEQGEALRIGVADDVPRQFDEGSRHRKARRDGCAEFGCEQVGVAAFDLPDDRACRHARFGEVARSVAPAFEIVRRGERHAMGVDHRAFA